MSRTVVLLVLALAALVACRNTRGRRLAPNVAPSREPLHTWEGEGGAVASPALRSSAAGAGVST